MTSNSKRKLTYGFVFHLPKIFTNTPNNSNLPIELTEQFEIMNYKKVPRLWKWLHD